MLLFLIPELFQTVFEDLVDLIQFQKLYAKSDIGELRYSTLGLGLSSIVDTDFFIRLCAHDGRSTYALFEGNGWGGC